MFDLPYRTAPWEPAYALATYTDDGAEFPSAAAGLGRARSSRGGRAAERLDDDAVELAVRQLVETWTAIVERRAEVAASRGGR